MSQNQQKASKVSKSKVPKSYAKAVENVEGENEEFENTIETEYGAIKKNLLRLKQIRVDTGAGKSLVLKDPKSVYEFISSNKKLLTTWDGYVQKYLHFSIIGLLKLVSNLLSKKYDFSVATLQPFQFIEVIHMISLGRVPVNRAAAFKLIIEEFADSIEIKQIAGVYDNVGFLTPTGAEIVRTEMRARELLQQYGLTFLNYLMPAYSGNASSITFARMIKARFGDFGNPSGDITSRDMLKVVDSVNTWAMTKTTVEDLFPDQDLDIDRIYFHYFGENSNSVSGSVPSTVASVLRMEQQDTQGKLFSRRLGAVKLESPNGREFFVPQDIASGFKWDIFGNIVTSEDIEAFNILNDYYQANISKGEFTLYLYYKNQIISNPTYGTEWALNLKRFYNYGMSQKSKEITLAAAMKKIGEYIGSEKEISQEELSRIVNDPIKRLENMNQEFSQFTDPLNRLYKMDNVNSLLELLSSKELRNSLRIQEFANTPRILIEAGVLPPVKADVVQTADRKDEQLGFLINEVFDGIEVEVEPEGRIMRFTVGEPRVYSIMVTSPKLVVFEEFGEFPTFTNINKTICSYKPVRNMVYTAGLSVVNLAARMIKFAYVRLLSELEPDNAVEYLKPMIETYQTLCSKYETTIFWNGTDDRQMERLRKVYSVHELRGVPKYKGVTEYNFINILEDTEIIEYFAEYLIYAFPLSQQLLPLNIDFIEMARFDLGLNGLFAHEEKEEGDSGNLYSSAIGAKTYFAFDGSSHAGLDFGGLIKNSVVRTILLAEVAVRDCMSVKAETWVNRHDIAMLAELKPKPELYEIDAKLVRNYGNNCRAYDLPFQVLHRRFIKNCPNFLSSSNPNPPRHLLGFNPFKGGLHNLILKLYSNKGKVVVFSDNVYFVDLEGNWYSLDASSCEASIMPNHVFMLYYHLIKNGVGLTDAEMAKIIKGEDIKSPKIRSALARYCLVFAPLLTCNKVLLFHTRQLINKGQLSGVIGTGYNNTMATLFFAFHLENLMKTKKDLKTCYNTKISPVEGSLNDLDEEGLLPKVANLARGCGLKMKLELITFNIIARMKDPTTPYLKLDMLGFDGFVINTYNPLKPEEPNKLICPVLAQDRLFNSLLVPKTQYYHQLKKLASNREQLKLLKKLKKTKDEEEKAAIQALLGNKEENEKAVEAEKFSEAVLGVAKYTSLLYVGWYNTFIYDIIVQKLGEYWINITEKVEITPELQQELIASLAIELGEDNAQSLINAIGAQYLAPRIPSMWNIINFGLGMESADLFVLEHIRIMMITNKEIHYPTLNKLLSDEELNAIIIRQKDNLASIDSDIPLKMVEQSLFSAAYSLLEVKQAEEPEVNFVGLIYSPATNIKEGLKEESFVNQLGTYLNFNPRVRQWDVIDPWQKKHTGEDEPVFSFSYQQLSEHKIDIGIIQKQVRPLVESAVGGKARNIAPRKGTKSRTASTYYSQAEMEASTKLYSTAALNPNEKQDLDVYFDELPLDSEDAGLRTIILDYDPSVDPAILLADAEDTKNYIKMQKFLRALVKTALAKATHVRESAASQWLHDKLVITEPGKPDTVSDTTDFFQIVWREEPTVVHEKWVKAMEDIVNSSTLKLKLVGKGKRPKLQPVGQISSENQEVILPPSEEDIEAFYDQNATISTPPPEEEEDLDLQHGNEKFYQLKSDEFPPLERENK